MIALLMIPALLSLAFVFDFFGDDEATATEDARNDPETEELTDENDIFIGNNLGESIVAGPGDDYVDSKGGDDRIFAGSGDDTVNAGDGNDRMLGGTGDDVIYGGAGQDLVRPGDGDDRVFLGSGNDFVQKSDEGDDFIRGGKGADFIDDRAGANTIFGEEGADLLIAVDEDGAANAGADTVHGGYGNDIIIADEGDVVTGGANEDQFFVEIGTANDNDPTLITDMNPAEDRVTLLFNENAVNAEVELLQADNGEDVNVLVDGNLQTVLQGVKLADLDGSNFAMASSETGAPDADAQISTKLTAGDDTFEVLLPVINVVHGLEGNDVITTADHGDDLFPGEHTTLNGNAGDDLLSVLSGTAVLVGGEGNDTLSASGDASFDGGAGDDVINTSGAAMVALGEGADVVNISGKDDAEVYETTVISDMNPAEDVIVININSGFGITPGDDFSVSTALAANGNDVEIKLDGQLISLLQNVKIDDITIDENVQVLYALP
ncbi:MAG: calcium-binding protein [Paracoccaceae bacterium]